MKNKMLQEIMVILIGEFLMLHCFHFLFTKSEMKPGHY